MRAWPRRSALSSGRRGGKRAGRKLLRTPGDGAVTSNRADHPRNLQSWSQHRAAVFGRPQILVMPIKSLQVEHRGSRSGRPAASLPGDLSPQQVPQIPQERGQERLVAPGGQTEATAEPAAPRGRHRHRRGGRSRAGSLHVLCSQLGHHFPLNTFFRSSFHHWLHHQATGSFCFRERKQNPVNPLDTYII